METDFPKAAERYRGFRDQIFESADYSVREDVALNREAVDFSEMEIQARWFGGEFGRTFETTDGETVEVVQFGHWNHSAGPDFTEAAVKIGDEIRTGAIELDLEVESWEGHGHGSNPAFNEVVLHVFLVGPKASESRFFTRSEDHRSIPQVQIFLPEHAARPAPLHLPEAKLGRCATPLLEMPEEKLVSLLDAAAQYRLQQKSRRLRKIEAVHGKNQALFQAIAEALGFRYNKVTMAILSQRLRISDLRNRPALEREALLFGAAGFIGPEEFEAVDDPASRAYLKGLWDHWWKLRSDFEPEEARALNWKLAGTRPTNHPQRRLGALASLVNSWSGFSKAALDFESGDWNSRTKSKLAGLSHDFWNVNYTLRSNPSEKPMTLIGKSRIHDILGNILYPLAVAASARGNWEGYKKLPGSDSNESLRRAVLRLFGEGTGRGKEFSKRYFQQQALLQIFQDFCLEDFSECADCPFPEQLKQWG